MIRLTTQGRIRLSGGVVDASIYRNSLPFMKDTDASRTNSQPWTRMLRHGIRVHWGFECGSSAHPPILSQWTSQRRGPLKPKAMQLCKSSSCGDGSSAQDLNAKSSLNDTGNSEAKQLEKDIVSDKIGSGGK